jgi:tripartite-type tricarboxylate transporter receptor subunit TctC
MMSVIFMHVSWHKTGGGKVKRLLVALLAALSGTAFAQQFPARNIQMIVPFAPGGATDYMARTIAAKIQASLGQTVVVENRPGANAIVGSEVVAKATPDGHSIFLCALGHASNPSLYKLPYDTLKDFAPVTLLVTGPLMLVTHPSIPVKSVQELVAHMKANPGKLSFASGGTGSSQHFAFELLLATTGTKAIHVPYKGTAPAYADLLSGTVSMMFDNLVIANPQVKAGKLRAIAVSQAKRTSQAPDVPTVAEQGFPGFDTGIWHGFLTTGGTPKSTVDRLNKEIVAAVNSPDVKEEFLKRGLDPVGNTPEQFDQFIRSEVAKWAKVVKDAGIKAD